MTEPVAISKERAAEIVRESTHIIDDEDDDMHGQPSMTHCIRGMGRIALGCYWDLHAVLDLISQSDEIRIIPPQMGHRLAVRTDEEWRLFDVGEIEGEPV